MELTKYDTMCQAIAEAYEVDEVKDIRDKAYAIELYSRMAKSPEPERRACEIRLRSERRCGELLKEIELAKGTRGTASGRDSSGGSIIRPPENDIPTLSDMGITKDQSSNWQKLADVPEDKFEEALAAPEKPSTTGIIKKYSDPISEKIAKIDDKVLFFCGRLTGIESLGIFEWNRERLYATMTESMKEDVERISPILVKFLQRIQNEK